MDSPPRPVRVVKEPVGAKNQRKMNFVPKDEELLTTKKLWEFNASQVPPPRKLVTKPFNWKTTNQEMANAVAIASSRKSRKSKKSKKSKKSRRTRKN
jgi:hypothetical protein